MKTIKPKWNMGLLPLYAVIILLAASFLYSYMYTDAERLFLTPVFTDNNGWEIYRLEDGVKKNITVEELSENSGETIYLSRTLDQELEDGGYTILELDGMAWQESVFLDGALLYTANPALDNRIGHVEFSEEYQGIQGMGEYVRLSLPPGYGGKTLTIAAAANTAIKEHSTPMIRLSSEAVQTQLLVSDANRISIPAAVCMTAAVLLLGLFFYNLYYDRKSFSILLLTLAALIQALRILLDFEFRFSSHFALDFITSELLVPLAYGLPLLYLLTQMKRWKKWYAPFLLIPLVLSVGLHIMGRIPVFTAVSSYSYDAVLYIPLLALGVFVVLEWKDRNTVYRLFTPAFLAVTAVILLDALGCAMAGKASILTSILRMPGYFLYEAFLYSGGILLFLAGGISFLLTVKKAADTQSALSVMTARNELVKENIRSIQESSTEISAMRHDMLRHLHAMLDLSQQGENKRLESYLKELAEETEDILPLQVCQHPLVNALVTRSLASAKRERIQMEYHVEVPADLPVTDSDLCILVMNMLDNAIEAVSSLSEEKKRTIELTMHVRGRYLFIETINYCERAVLVDAETGLFISMKGPGHGYGMKAMSEIAKKYKSILQVRQEGDTVMVRTALLIPGEKE
ncbi:sensor histidine kinase [Murimonas intestini]|uniref:GHKL domain-containing protein n=1 Tax=Murimonas intestini TaxID=1337051 RepID=A0AB73T8V7_9FIRM|nr:GHKL domain-containing protein [Murimonas intestini]MCR1839930.1 GHKL domain-containing protein [Murimonas intestini]MCR1866770.1 GHKL domain-containing protein [Murimonas intestini]MCR1883603.1 GHKL domain-containing protein [Murimonas intestini]